MSAERGTTYHLDSWDELVKQKKAEADAKGPYHRTYDSVRVQANKLLRTMPPEEDRAARERRLDELRAEVYMNNKKDKECGASKSRSMAVMVPGNKHSHRSHLHDDVDDNDDNASSTALIEAIDHEAPAVAANVGARSAQLPFRERCEQLLGLLWWDKMDDTLMPRADARRELCQSMLHIVGLGGMGSPSEPGYAMTLLLYWCQQTINHQVGPITALSREQLRHNCELIYRALGVTGRSVYVPPFLQPHTYQIVGRFSEHGAAVFGLIWLFRDYWPMSRVPKCGSMADAQLHTLTKYVMPLVTSCVERRATEQEWLRELCRLSVRLSPQHLEHAGTFHTDEGFLLDLRDTAFGRQLEAHVYAHVKDDAAQYSLFKYLDQHERYLAHVQRKLQQQAELRLAAARQARQQVVDEDEDRQWLHDSTESLRRQLAHPALRRLARQLVAGPELKLLGRYDAPPGSFKDRYTPPAPAEQPDDGPPKRQHWRIRRDHTFTAEDVQHLQRERQQQRQLRKKRRAKKKRQLRQREGVAACWADVNDVWRDEPPTPTRSDRGEEEEDARHFDFDSDSVEALAPLDPDQRDYYHALWRRHVVHPTSDHRRSPLPLPLLADAAAPTGWTAFRQFVAQLDEQESCQLECHLRNGVQPVSPCVSDADVDQSKQRDPRLLAAACVGERKAPLPTSSIAPWTLRSTEGFFECALDDDGAKQA